MRLRLRGLPPSPPPPSRPPVVSVVVSVEVASSCRCFRCFAPTLRLFRGGVQAGGLPCRARLPFPAPPLVFLRHGGPPPPRRVQKGRQKERPPPLQLPHQSPRFGLKTLPWVALWGRVPFSPLRAAGVLLLVHGWRRAKVKKGGSKKKERREGGNARWFGARTPRRWGGLEEGGGDG